VRQGFSEECARVHNSNCAVRNGQFGRIVAQITGDYVVGTRCCGALQKAIVIVVDRCCDLCGGFHGESDTLKRGQQFLRAGGHGGEFSPRQYIAIFREYVRRNAGGDLAGHRQVHDLSFQPVRLPAGGNQDIRVENHAH